ncbi:hypothetical protein ACOME3_000563 [Neoechinorhynchus agilis]
MVYGEALKVLRQHIDEKIPLKTAIYSSPYTNYGRLLALVSMTLENQRKIKKIIRSSGLLEREKFLDQRLAMLLVHDACFGKGVGKCKFKGLIKRNQTFLDEAFKKLGLKKTEKKQKSGLRYGVLNIFKSNRKIAKRFLKKELKMHRCRNIDRITSSENKKQFFVDQNDCFLFKNEDSKPLLQNPNSNLHFYFMDKSSCMAAECLLDCEYFYNAAKAGNWSIWIFLGLKRKK